VDDMTWYTLALNPEPWAIGPVGYRRSGGKMSAYVGRNAQLDAYKEAVREEIGPGPHPVIEGKVKLVLLFWRNRAEYKTAQSRTHRKHEADLTNMVKATEDALQGLLFVNDRDNNEIQAGIIEQGPDVNPCIIIGVGPSSEIPDIIHSVPNFVWERLDGTQQLTLDVVEPSTIPAHNHTNPAFYSDCPGCAWNKNPF